MATPFSFLMTLALYFGMFELNHQIIVDDEPFIADFEFIDSWDSLKIESNILTTYCPTFPELDKPKSLKIKIDIENLIIDRSEIIQSFN